MRLCLIRSVWDYHLRYDEFLAWLDSLPAGMQVWNPPDVLLWNSHKGYLRELETKGVPIVPTEWFSPGDSPDLESLVRQNGWDAVVVKPVVSADGHNTSLFGASDIGLGQKHLEALLSDGEAMVQRFMDEVQASGERCVIEIGGEITHAVQKTTVFDPTFEDRPPLIEITEEETRLARAAIAAASFDHLYARVDIVRDERGAPRLMELEMFEPTLYFVEEPESAERFADRVVELLGIG